MWLKSTYDFNVSIYGFKMMMDKNLFKCLGFMQEIGKKRRIIDNIK